MKPKLLPVSKEIIPKWTRKLNKKDIDPGPGLDMNDYRFCMVGEANGFDDHYRFTCDTCHEFSKSIPGLLKKIKVRYACIGASPYKHYFINEKPIVIDRMISRTNRFLEHFVKKHKR